MATLYRKYRPQNFEEVVGQSHIKITLTNEIATGNIAHAYLFCGPRAVGKTTLARVFAKSVNCSNRKSGESEPCSTCQPCEEITLGKSLDVIEIDAASHTGVDNVRENIIAVSKVAPSSLKYKVFIIDEVHMLSVSAFNALLKILEEPPQNVIFILATTEVHKIPTTIISRCQRFDFKRINITDMVKKLRYIADQEKVKIDEKILENIARHSEGYMRDAESIFGQILAISGGDAKKDNEVTEKDADLVIPRSDLSEAIKFVEHLSKKDAGSAIGLVNSIIDEGIDLKKFISDVVELMRRLVLVKINPVLAEKFGLELGESLEIKINEITKIIEVPFLVGAMERIMKAHNEISKSFIMQLPVEIAVAEICLGGGTVEATSPPAPVTPPQVNNTPIKPVVKTPTNPPVKKETQENRASSSNVSMDEDSIMGKWHEVLAGIKKYNHSLGFILRACKPVGVVDGQIKMVFKYKFHKERIEEVSIKAMVEKVLQEVYGSNLSISATVDEGLDIADTAQPKEELTASSESVSEVVEVENNPAETEEKKEEVKEEVESASKTEGQKENESDMLNNLLKTFGGKIVN